MMADWLLLMDEEPGGAAENMAVDEWLFNACHREKCGFLRFYSWALPTFSFGISQKNVKAVNCDFIERSGCALVRRVTGGKTVLHNDELTYAVISSEDIFYRDHDLYQSYLLISRVLLDALKSLGIDASLSAGSIPEMSKSSHPCFSFPTPNEIEIRGKKIIGSAQKRDKVALLQHGSIPFSMDYNLYAGGANSEAAFIQKSMITLAEVADVSRSQVRDAITASFQRFIGHDLMPMERKSIQGDPDYSKLVEKYASDEWNFSR